MPPKRTTNPKSGRTAASPDLDPEPDTTAQHEQEEEEGEEGAPKARIPEELVARILSEQFKREDTKVSRAAGRALSRYFEIFVQEAIARTAQERDGRFLEVGVPVFPFLYSLCCCFQCGYLARDAIASCPAGGACRRASWTSLLTTE